MRTLIRYAWDRLNASFWFAPTCMMAAAAVLAGILLTVDSRFELPWFADPQSLLFISAEGSRQLLAVIAGSMITVASLVFSMTLIALQLASSQFGPRLITRFMSDKVNQVLLGTFIATFLYALIVLRSIEGGDYAFVPHLSVLAALLLTVASLGWLIFFIHHVAETIQADTTVADVTHELHHAIHGRFPEADLAEPQMVRAPAPDAVKPQDGRSIDFDRVGYIQVIDIDALLSLAVEHDLLIEALRRPGHFAIPATPAFRVAPRGAVDERLMQALRSAIILSYRRTPMQDIEFAFSSLISIALRALSPALNDPITAATCIDRLTAAFGELLRAPPPPRQILDEEHRLRLIVHPVSFEELLQAVFHELGASARGHASVLLRLIGALTVLASLARSDEDRGAIAGEASRLERLCRTTLEDEDDRAAAERHLAELRGTLEGRTGAA